VKIFAHNYQIDLQVMDQVVLLLMHYIYHMVQNNILVEYPHKFQVVDKIDIQDEVVVHEISLVPI
jgi:hypothetical protein